MKLRELAEATGVPVPSIKYWIREGILHPGTLRNQTTAVYDERHVERLELIVTLRDEFHLPIARIHELTGLIDDPTVPLVEVMEQCQLIATGLSREGSERALTEGYGAQVSGLVATAGWPDVSSVARDALATVLRDAERVGVRFDSDDLARHARALIEIATRDIEYIQPNGTRDAVARNLLRGAAAQTRVLLAVNQLAHTSAAIAAL